MSSRSDLHNLHDDGMVGQFQVWIADFAGQAHLQELLHSCLALCVRIQQQPEPPDIGYKGSLCFQDVVDASWLAQLQVKTPSNAS